MVQSCRPHFVLMTAKVNNETPAAEGIHIQGPDDAGASYQLIGAPLLGRGFKGNHWELGKLIQHCINLIVSKC